jgi:hypothetical protein
MRKKKEKLPSSDLHGETEDYVQSILKKLFLPNKQMKTLRKNFVFKNKKTGF